MAVYAPAIKGDAMEQFKNLFKQKDSRIYSLFVYTDGRGHFDPNGNATLDYWAHDQTFDFTEHPLRRNGLEDDDIILVWASIAACHDGNEYLLVDAQPFGEAECTICFQDHDMRLGEFIERNRNAVRLRTGNIKPTANAVYDHSDLFHMECEVANQATDPRDWNDPELRETRYAQWVEDRKLPADDSDEYRKKRTTQKNYLNALRKTLRHDADATKIKPQSLVERLLDEKASQASVSSLTIADIIPGYDVCLNHDDCHGIIECADAPVLRKLADGWRQVREFDGSGTASAALSQYIEFLDYDPYTAGGNIIYFGAPGTGKSHMLNQSLRTYGDYERVTFYADYLHTQFVGSLRPVMEPTGRKDEPDRLAYRFVPGSFTNVLIQALNDKDHQYALVIEEINRADAASVFGDLFQLLDRTDAGVSEYAITASADLSSYLRAQLSEQGLRRLAELTRRNVTDMQAPNSPAKTNAAPLRIVIPPNMSILATMNSADQGVFPLDTAFKRRWDFVYVGIDNGASATGDRWDAYRRHINELLLTKAKVNEDKLIGPFFIRETIPQNAQRIPKRFSNIFKYKVLMYLFEDAARYKRKEIFGPELNTLGKLFAAWDRENFGVFTGMGPFVPSASGTDSADRESDQ